MGLFDNWSRFGNPITGGYNRAGLLGPMTMGEMFPPQQGTIAAPTPAAASSGFDWGPDSSIWSSLMGLGAGLATGGAPGGGGWGSGIGKGIGLAAELNQNRQTLKDKEAARALQLATLQNTMQNQQIMQQLGLANLGVRQQTEERQAETARKPEADQLTSLASGAGTWKDTADYLTNPKNWGYGGAAWEGITGSGPIKDAQSRVQQVVEAGLGRKLTKDEVTAYVPQLNDSEQARIDKIARASELAKSRVQTSGSGKTENYRTGLKPIGNAFSYVPPGATPPPAAAPAAAPQQAGAAGGGQPPPPPSLAGKPLQWSATMQLFRDKTDGSLYNTNGELVGQ